MRCPDREGIFPIPHLFRKALNHARSHAVADIEPSRESCHSFVGGIDRRARDPDGRPLVPHHGQLDADLLAARCGPAWRSGWSCRPWWRLRATRPLIPVSASRTPFFCSGCPHNTATRCPTARWWAPASAATAWSRSWTRARVGEIVGMTQMGGEGTQWIGIEPFVDHAAPASRTSATARSSTRARWPSAPPWRPAATSPTRCSTTAPSP